MQLDSRKNQRNIFTSFSKVEIFYKDVILRPIFRHFCLTGYPGELKSGVQVTIIHPMLPSRVRVFCLVILSQSDNEWQGTLGKMFIAYYHVISHDIVILIYLEMNLIGEFFLAGSPG